MLCCDFAPQGESRRGNEGIRLESGTLPSTVRQKRRADGESRSLMEYLSVEKARPGALIQL